MVGPGWIGEGGGTAGEGVGTDGKPDGKGKVVAGFDDDFEIVAAGDGEAELAVLYAEGWVYCRSGRVPEHSGTAGVECAPAGGSRQVVNVVSGKVNINL